MGRRYSQKMICAWVIIVMLFCPPPGRAAMPDDATATPPKEILLPSNPGQPPPSLFPQWEGENEFIYYKPGSIYEQSPLPPSILQPPREVATGETTYLVAEPAFYSLSQTLPLSDAARLFLEETLIPGESTYFMPGTGMNAKTGMPYDHIRIRLKENLLSEVGNYTAASKLSLMIPFLLKVIQKNPYYRQVKLTPQEATAELRQTLRTLLVYIQKYPDYGGFLPWVDIRPNGTIAPATTKVPSLDNGQMTWSLAAVIAAFEDSSDPELRKISDMAQKILQTQHYGKFYDEKKQLLHGTIQYDTETHVWTGDKTYYLNDMFEGTLAVLWGVLNGQIPEVAWDNLTIPTTEYTTEAEEKITTLAGFRASFHEHWALAYLPIMRSALAPLYQNYLYAQADHARRNHLPGFLSTAYDAKGVYRQMGIASLAYNPVDRGDVAVLFATAMGMLISPTVGASWLTKFYTFKGFVSPYGAFESVGRDGYADIFTADAKGMTLLAASGGVVDEIEKFLSERTVPRTGIPMNVKLIELLHSKYKQMTASRDGRPIFFPSKPFPAPPEKVITVHHKKPPDAGNVFDVIAHLQPGHLHGKNVRSVGQKTLEQDIFPGQPIQFEFDIPAYYAYFDQWAFRGTYIDKAVRIADMRYITLTLPRWDPPCVFELEIKSDDITLATVVVNTSKPGRISGDGQWKTLVEKISPIPDSDDKPFNYVSVAIHDPRYLLEELTRGGREGTIRLKEIALYKKFPFKDMPEPSQKEKSLFSEELELIRYWRPNHGALPLEKNGPQGIYRFSSGLGWRGGYIPYTNLSKFRYLYLKVRNLSKEEKGCFYVELKHESDQLLGEKIPVILPADDEWRIYEIAIPLELRYTFNYIAISDPDTDFELGSILLATEKISEDLGMIEKVKRAPRKRRSPFVHVPPPPSSPPAQIPENN